MQLTTVCIYELSNNSEKLSNDLMSLNVSIQCVGQRQNAHNGIKLSSQW